MKWRLGGDRRLGRVRKGRKREQRRLWTEWNSKEGPWGKGGLGRARGMGRKMEGKGKGEAGIGKGKMGKRRGR